MCTLAVWIQSFIFQRVQNTARVERYLQIFRGQHITIITETKCLLYVYALGLCNHWF